MRKMGLAAASLLALSGLAFAQEKPAAERPRSEPAVTDQDEERPQPTRSIRVLQHPYDIASFYRSNQGGSSQGSYGGASFQYPLGDPRYAIAGYYRNQQSRPAPLIGMGGNGAFGTNSNRRGRVPVRNFARRGELFLFAPTFLAPFGPFRGAVWGER